MLKKFVFVGALALGSVVSQAQTHTVLSEGFDKVDALAASGWVLLNNSTPPGRTEGWYQGDQQVFTSQAGAPEAYVASNFETAAPGGRVDNWLISPTFSTAVAGTVSFWARSDVDGPSSTTFFDAINFGFSSGSSAVGDFKLGSTSVVSGDWTLYSVSFASQGTGSTGRFAIHYTGQADLSSYVGVDTFSVTAVPEPSTWALMGLGLLGIAGARRRAQKQPATIASTAAAA